MKISRLILLLMIVGMLLIPAVSAQEYSESTYTQWSYDGDNTMGYQIGVPFTSIKFKDITQYPNLEGFAHVYPAPVTTNSVSDSTTFTAKIGSTIVGHGTISYNKNYGPTGAYRNCIVALKFSDWNTGSYTGTQTVSLTLDTSQGYSATASMNVRTQGVLNDPKAVYFVGTGEALAGDLSAYGAYEWKISADYHEGIAIIDRQGYSSYVEIVNTEFPSIVYYSKLSTESVNIDCLMSNSITFTATSPIGNTYNDQFSLSGEVPVNPTESPVNIYVKNSQTGALISNSHIDIKASVEGELYSVVNKTLPAGYYGGTLQQTGGGMPNPDFYRVTVTADGYNAEMPYADFTIDSDTEIMMVMGMEPTSGGPEDPGKTYIDVYVRDIYANPIADATVKMGVYTLKTNAAGYTLFDMPVNSTYTYTVKKTGYTTIEGSVTVADAARYTVNVVLGTGVIPTNTPTAEPTVPGATPTVPAGEETPGPGFIDQSANNFATFLGVSYAVGRAALGMLIATAIGFTTARKLKGGAPEFGIGFIAGAALMVLITLLPAWIFIVMVIIVGGLLGYKYMNGGS